jgi:hypothetical protein
MYANNIPLVWLDDKQSTVMKAVTEILGEGWNKKEVTENEAVTLYNKVLWDMKITGRPGNPINSGGYYTLPEFVTKKSGYCFEVAQFGFWFFSELRINSLCASIYLSADVLHEAVKLKSGRIVDYFRNSKLSGNKWQNVNPIQEIALYYTALSYKENNSLVRLESAVLYDKYNLAIMQVLMSVAIKMYDDYKNTIAYGRFLLDNIDINAIISANHLGATDNRNYLRDAIWFLGRAYYGNYDSEKIQYIVDLLIKYYKSDKYTKTYIDFLKTRIRK